MDEKIIELQDVLKQIGELIKADKDSSNRFINDFAKSLNDGKTSAEDFLGIFKEFYNRMSASVDSTGKKITSVTRMSADEIRKTAQLITNDVLIAILKVKKKLDEDNEDLVKKYKQSIRSLQANIRKAEKEMDNEDSDTPSIVSKKKLGDMESSSVDTFTDRVYNAYRDYSNLSATDKSPDSIITYWRNLSDFVSANSILPTTPKDKDKYTDEMWRLASQNVTSYRGKDASWISTLKSNYQQEGLLKQYYLGRIDLMEEEVEILQKSSAIAEKMNYEEEKYNNELRKRNDINRNRTGVMVAFQNELDSGMANLFGKGMFGSSARAIIQAHNDYRTQEAKSNLEISNLDSDLASGKISQEQYNVRKQKITDSLADSKLASKYGALIKIAQDLAKKITETVGKMKNEIIELFKLAWKDIKIVAQYDLGTSYTFNSSARNQALTYGLNGSQNYAFTQTQKIMGMSSLEDLYFANPNQQAMFQTLMAKEEEIYNKMLSDGTLESFQEMQIEFQVIKQEFEAEVIKFLSENKDTIMNFMRLGVEVLKFQLSIVSGIMSVITWFTGGDVNSDKKKSITSGVYNSSDIMQSTDYLANNSTTNNNQRTLNVNSTYSPTVNSYNDGNQSFKSYLDQQKVALSNFFNS